MQTIKMLATEAHNELYDYMLLLYRVLFNGQKGLQKAL